VEIRSGERTLGRVVADAGGEWVWLSDGPLAPGSYQLELVAQVPGRDRPVVSEDVVVLVVPEARRDIAGAQTPDPAPADPLILMAPRDEVGPTRPLQVPEPPGTVDTALREPPDTAVEQAETPPAMGQQATAPASAAEDAPPPAAALPVDVAIEVVDYDDAGRLIVSGTAVPDSAVRLYLDGETAGEAAADDRGRWTVRVAEPVAPGTYRLRADMLADDGTVVARAEIPFRRDAAPAEIPPGHTEVVVQPGNSLWRIARRVYGEGMQYTVIYQANVSQIRDPDLIYPGQIFSLPAPPPTIPAGEPG